MFSIFKKKIIIPHVRMTGVIGSVGRFKQGLDLANQQDILKKAFSYKKPNGYPYKASAEQQKKFIATYEELKNTISPEDGIMFMDPCHQSMATKITHGWIKTGQSKAIETTASRTRINLVGAISLNNIPKPVVSAYDTVDVGPIIDFLHLLRNC